MNDSQRIVRYMSQVVKTETCWFWQGCKNDDGYPWISFHGKSDHGNRVFWKLFKGEIPDKLHVLHTCDNPGCVNPDHLYLGTQKENQRDRVMRGRHNMAKLSPNQITEIRSLYIQGLSQRNIASKFGISQGHVSDIVNKHRWSYLP